MRMTCRRHPAQTLRLLCDAVGVEFSDAMLSWPPGLRETDGVWAKYWYAEVENSTGFRAPRSRATEVQKQLEPVYEEALANLRTTRGRTGCIEAEGRSEMLQKFDERNRDLLININGDLSHRDEAGISPFDSAVQGGDAVWEGLRLYRGRIFKLHEHLVRLRNSATALSFADIPADEEIIEQIRRTLAANQMHDGVHIRLTLTRGVKVTSGMDPRLNRSGPTLIVLAEHKAPVYAKTGLSLDHEHDSPAAAGDSRSADSSCESAELDPRENRGEQRRAPTMRSCSIRAASSRRRTRRTSSWCGTGCVLTSHVVACPEGITRATVLEICAANGIRMRRSRSVGQ